MAQIIGKVEKLDGKFYVQDENGNMRELKVGDEVKENEIILGSDGNNETNKIIISLNGSNDNIEVLSNAQLKLDNTLLNLTPQNDETTTTRESLNNALENVEDKESQENQDNQEDNVPVIQTTKAQDQNQSEDDLDIDFIDRTADETDINSDLRISNSLQTGAIQAKFHGLQEGSSEDFGNFVSRTADETDINSDLRETDNSVDDNSDDEGVEDGIPTLSGENIIEDEAEYTEIIIDDNEVITEPTDSLLLPILTIDDQTIYEDAGLMTFTISLDKVAEDDVTFDYISSNISAISGDDYTSISGTNLTITKGSTSVTITVPIADDYIADNGETFSITLSNPSSNATIGDELGIGTILDNSQSDKIDAVEPVLVKLVALDKDGNEVPSNEVNEADPASYKVVLEDPDGNRITTATGTVEITFSGNTATDDVDYDSTTQIVDINTPFTTDTIDDYLADDGETYNVQITDDTYSNSTNYENVIHDTTPVVTTINDNSNPNTPNYDSDDTVEIDIDTIEIKLFAIDVTDGSRQAVNQVAEGNSAEYIAVAFDKDGNELSLNETVEITFSGNTATDDLDYTSTVQTVTLGVNFSTPTAADYPVDNGETYNIQITDNSMSNDTNYETVEIDTTPVVTTINDTSDPIIINDDTVYVVLTGDTSVIEGNTASYTVSLLDINGNAVTVTADTVVNVTFTNGTTEDEDTEYTNDDVIPVTIIAGTSSTGLDTDTIDDYLSDNGETYTLTISSIPSHEFLTIDFDGFTDSGSTVHIATQTTVITDNASETPIEVDTPEEPGGYDTTDDTVYVQLVTDDTVGEGEDLVHGIKLVDSTGSDVLLEAGQDVTVTLTYTGTSANPTEGSADFTSQTTVTIVGTIGGNNTATITNPSIDDYLAEGAEEYTISVDTISDDNSTFETIADYGDTVTGTILDGLDDEIPNEVDNDTVYAVLTGDTTVIEGNTASYTVSLLDIDGNAVTVTADTVVNVTFTNGTTEDEDTEYTNSQVIPVTIIAGTSSIALDTDTVDDYLSDNGEDYTLTISSIPTHEFEVIDIDGFTDSGSTVHIATQTTVITDNTGTPNTPSDDETEPTLDEVIIKLVACDLNGDPILSGSNYTLVNDGYEGDTPTYMALAFVPGTTDFTTANKLPDAEQDGTVAVTFTDGTANGTSSLVTQDGSEDFNNDGQTVALGVAFSTSTFDDFTSDDGETYNVQITDNSYVEGTVVYENVSIDTTAVITTIYDDISIGTPDDAYVDEDDFDVTDPSITLIGKEHTTSGGSLDTTGNGTTGNNSLLNISTSPSNYNDYTFDFDTTISSKMDSNSSAITPLQSVGVTIEYVTVGDTITAYKGSGRLDADKVFDITLDKNAAGGADDGYTYTQYQNIDHQINNNDDTVVLTFGYTVTNDGQTSDIFNFDVVVNDSLPTAVNDSRITPEDTDLLIVISDESFAAGQITLNNGVEDSSANSAGPSDGQLLNNGDTINIYDNAIDKNVVGVVENNGDGTLTFNPNEDFSGNTLGFSYDGATDSDGDSASGTIDLTVTPVADTPNMNGANSGLSEATIITAQTTEDINNTDEGNQITTIGFILPTNEDGASTPGDYTGDNVNDDEIEKFGLISIIADDGIIISANGSDYTFSSGDPITVYINDVTDYHHVEVSAGDADISLTQAQFEAIQVKHSEDDAVNPIFTISIDSYELNDNDTLKTGPIKANNTQDYEVDILAVTDPVTLIYNHNDDADGDNTTADFGTADEGTAGTIIDLGAQLTETFGDGDGSEQRSYTVSGIPEGTILNLDGNKVAAGPDGIATVFFPDNTVDDPSFTMTISEQFSGTINGTITLTALDTDSDSTGIITEQTDAVTFTATVNPLADIVTLQVKQAIGDEDAGRSTGNIANDGTADDIDDAANGIDLDIKVTSDDDKDLAGAASIDEKEIYVVTIDSIPEDGSIYYSDANGTITITRNVDNTTTTTGSNTNVTMDSDDGTTWTIKISDFDNDAPLKFIPPHNDDSDYTFNVEAYSDDKGNISVTQTLQIDVTVNDVADIPVNDTLASTTVADDDSDNNVFTLTTTEDSGSINLKTVLATPGTLDSYDNETTGSETETLTMKVTNLADGFDIEGATFLGGTGTHRIWFIDLADLQADAITLTSPEHFAGEITFDIAMVTTEDAGDSKTHDAQEISVMITTEVDTTVNTEDAQNEDETITLDFGLTKPDSDSSASGEETLISFGIDMSTVDAGVILTGSSSGVLSGGSYVSLDVTSGVLETVTATFTEDSHMNDGYDFNIQYTIDDVAVDIDGNTYTVTKNETDIDYNVTVSAVTDTINLTTDNSDVTVTDNISFTKALNVAGLDWNNDNVTGNADIDASEQFTRVEVSGVPQGVTVVDGEYAGDTDDGNYSGFWYVNIADQDIDGDDAQYNLQFNVDGAPTNGTYNITVIAYNEDNSNGVEQSDSEMFNLIVNNASSWTGQTVGTVATINSFTQDIDTDSIADHANAGMTDSDAYEGSILREDTQFTLGSVVDVSTTDSSTFSITLKNVPANVIIEGMTQNGDYYTVSGSGNQTNIEAILNSILITPNSNENTDASDISGTDLAFDIELTTYATGGIQQTSLINFTASVLPETDVMDLTVVNDGTTQEDTTQAFSITLDNAADGSNFTIVDGTVYLQLTENFSDIQGSDGVSGIFKYEGSTITTQTISGVSGITNGDYYVIIGVSPNDVLNFTYEPAEDRNGTVDVDVFVKNIESETWNPFNTTEMTSTQTITFTVTSVEDGYASAPVVTATGIEDNLVEVSVTATNPDSSELLASVSLDGIPDGFLIVYGADEGSAVVAQNIGDNDTFDDTNDSTKAATGFDIGNEEYVGFNLWNIPLTSGEMPAYIGIKAPEDWSGDIADITFNITSETGTTTTTTFTASITPDVDSLTLNATQTFGSAGEDIELKLNANVDDIDGSETVTLTLSGFGDDSATFKSAGTAISSTYNSGTDTYTIEGIEALDINDLTVSHSAVDATITATAKMVESDGSESSVVNTNNTFTISISESIASSGDDTLLYAGTGNSVDGLAGSDTLVLSGNSLTFDDIDNIEIIDLGAGDNTITGLSLDDILNMTDDNNELSIIGDNNDDVQSINATGWTEDSETDNGDGTTTYVYDKSSDTVTLTVDDNVNNTGL